MEIRSVGAELFHAYGRIDMTKPTVAPRNFANAYKMIRNGEMETLYRMERCVFSGCYPASYSSYITLLSSLFFFFFVLFFFPVY
jgi:hypothetical protein